jgi:uncharacterized protein RhaS with RHS repeats
LARQLTTNRQIDAYLRLVNHAAAHHAPTVASVIPDLAHEVRARVTLGVDDVSVYERLGNIGRTCWVTIAGRRWAFSYDYTTGKIELRRDSLQGTVVFQFDNSTSLTAIKRQAARL